MKATYWALQTKRGKLIESPLLGVPVLFKTRIEAENWRRGSGEFMPAPEGTKSVRVAVTVSGIEK